MYGERLGDGVEYHLMSPTPPVVKYHLRRGVGLIKFSKMVLDPSPPPLCVMREMHFMRDASLYGVATIRRLRKNIGFFCERNL